MSEESSRIYPIQALMFSTNCIWKTKKENLDIFLRAFVIASLSFII